MKEKDRTYWTVTNDEEVLSVIPLKNSFQSIEIHMDTLQERNDYLERENKELKSEKYKDNEIQRLNNKIKDYEKQFLRSFIITEDEEEEIKKFKDNHFQNHKHRGIFEYVFVPTELGDFGEIRCTVCGDKIIFKNL